MTRQDLHDVWKGESVFIIGGGPSLKNFDYSLIKSRKVIGVNNSYQLGSWVNVCWFGDLKWWEWHHENLKNYQGVIATCNMKPILHNNVKLVAYKRGKPRGIEEREDHVSWNACSGLSAINLAYHMGASVIILLGFDMQVQEPYKNWYYHSKEKMPLETAMKRYKHYMSYCPAIARDARKLGITILNAGPNSAIEDFEKVDLTEFLKEENYHV